MGASGLHNKHHPLFAYWVSHSEGYRVDLGTRRIGFVQETLIDQRNPESSLLAIRTGVFGRRIVLVHSDDVATIRPRGQRLLLRSHAPTAGAEPNERRPLREASSQSAATAERARRVGQLPTPFRRVTSP
jgi:hypothetical protein